MARARDVFTTIRSEGALLPSDFLQRIAEGDKQIPGLAPETYHLPPREKLSEAITRSWNRLVGFWSAFQSASATLKETDAGIGLTRDKWLLPLFQELGYGRLPGEPHALRPEDVHARRPGPRRAGAGVRRRRRAAGPSLAGAGLRLRDHGH